MSSIYFPKMPDPRHQSSTEIKEKARQLGFDITGIVSAVRSPRADYLHEWLSTHQHGSMSYLATRFEERVDPSVYLPGAQSVICLAMNYYVPLTPSPGTPACGELSRTREGRGEGNLELRTQNSELSGRIARYALGNDYHQILKSKLHALADWMRQQWPEIQTRACVDTAPLMEKDLAARAGIGWIGKNTCLINDRVGSWLFLGEIVTTLELPPDEPATDHCGTCTRCIDACPTQAITAPYQLDARKCISYLTIEHREEITESLQEKMGDWLYGCDICQDVCPHNRQPPQSTDPNFSPRFAEGAFPVETILKWQSADYQFALRGSAMKRIKLPLLQRNAAIVKQNAER
jgi:epoxyqueuosine reductase